MPQQEYVPESYWQAVKDRMAELAQKPIDYGKRLMQGASQAAPTDPNLRPGVAEQMPEALPGGMDPNSPEFQQRAAMARALMAGQAPQPQMPASAPREIQF